MAMAGVSVRELWLGLGWIYSLYGLLCATGNGGNGGQALLPSPCGQGGELYHAFPEDPAKYIQCDEWGRAYIRLCPRGNIWHNQHKTCVNMQTLDEAGGSHQAGVSADTGPSPGSQGMAQPQPQDGDPWQWLGEEEIHQLMKSMGYHEYGMSAGDQADMKQAHTSKSKSMSAGMMGDKSMMNHNGGRSMNSKSHMNGRGAAMPEPGSRGVMPKPMNAGMSKSMNSARNGAMSNSMGDMRKSVSMNDNMGGMKSPPMNSNTKSMGSMQKPVNSNAKSNPPGQVWLKSWHLLPMNTNGNQGNKPSTGKTWEPPTTDPPHTNTDPLNPCTHPSLQYIPHPVDPNKYFECIEGQAKEKSCGQGQIWRQTRRSCDRLPQQESGSTGQADDNPCFGTKQRFWPYLEDPRMYIECQGWYQFPLLRECEPGRVWVQRLSRCVSLHQPAETTTSRPPRPTLPPYTSPPPRTTRRPPVFPDSGSTGTGSTDSTSNFCINSDSFYHPYPPDKTKFIQCDEFGNMYIRYCGPKKKWDDGYKTCTGDNNVTVTNTSTSGGGSGGSVPSGGGSGSSGSTSIMENINESGGGRLDELLQSPCPGEAVYNPMTGQCLDMTDLSELANEILKISCPSGYKWDRDMAMCIQNEEKRDTRPFLDYNRGPNCETGYFWDTTLNFCIQAVPIDEMISALGNKKDADNYLRNRYPNLMPDKATGANLVSPEDRSRLGQDIRIPEYTGDSPCGSQEGLFYYTFPPDPRYFIQCDMSGAYFVQPCGQDMFWNQELVTCTPFNTQASQPADTQGADSQNRETGDGTNGNELDINDKTDSFVEEGDTMDRFDKVGPEMTGVELVGSEDLARNPCPDSSDVYYPYPYDSHMFVMCVGNMPFILACPDHLTWNNDISTCDWPDLGPDEEEYGEEYGDEYGDEADDSSDNDLGDNNM